MAKHYSFLFIALLLCSFASFSGEPEPQKPQIWVPIGLGEVEKPDNREGPGEEEPKTKDKSCSCTIL